MIRLQRHISEIEKLVADGTIPSFTLAALECRKAIESICYDRLRVSFDYISLEEIGKWQPKAVIDFLIENHDESIAQAFTMSVSTQPVSTSDVEGRNGLSEMTFHELGAQTALNPIRLGRLWQALSSFLHVRLPNSKDAPLLLQASLETLKPKVMEALDEIRQISSGTLITSGVKHETVSFDCACGRKNKRSRSSLKMGKVVYCSDPDCDHTWDPVFEGDAVRFEFRMVDVECSVCSSIASFPLGLFEKLGRQKSFKFTCKSCSSPNFIGWRLARMDSE